MTKRELYDIINEEIVNFKKGTINEELNESDKDLIRKIIRQKYLIFELFKKRKLNIMSNLLIETRLFEGRVNEDKVEELSLRVFAKDSGRKSELQDISKPILMRELKKYETLIKERSTLGELDILILL